MYQARRDNDYALLNKVLNRLENQDRGLATTNETLLWNLHPNTDVIKDQNAVLKEWDKATSLCDTFHLDMAMINWALDRKPAKPRSGKDLLNWAIERDCHFLLDHIVTVMGVPVDKQMVSNACTIINGKSFGSRHTIKFLLDKFYPKPPELSSSPEALEDPIKHKIENLQNEVSYLQWVNAELAMASVRQTKDYALLLKALNKADKVSSQGTGNEKPNEVYLLQVQLNVNRDDAMALCNTLGLMDAVEVWRQALGLVKERQVILSSFRNIPTIFTCGEAEQV